MTVNSTPKDQAEPGRIPNKLAITTRERCNPNSGTLSKASVRGLVEPHSRDIIPTTQPSSFGTGGVSVALGPEALESINQSINRLGEELGTITYTNRI
jgi:hypothetical protein